MIKQNYLLFLSFITGFSVMVIELTATRIIAPILGSSIYTWTSVIGIILLGSAIGNHTGGKIIDKYNKLSTVAYFFAAASIFVLFVTPIANFTSGSLLKFDSLWFATLTATSAFFFIPAFLLGSIYPMIAKQLLNKSNNLGQRAGTLSAIWSAGSIVGTFATGFYFTGHIGSKGTLLTISILLFACCLFLFLDLKTKIKVFFLYIIILTFYFGAINRFNPDATTVYHKESSYYDIKVIDKTFSSLGKARILFLDAGSHNIKSLSNKKSDSYVNFYPVFSIFNKEIRDIAMIGGGALEMSENFKNYYPDANILTAEIDPEVIKTAKKYFGTSEYIIQNTTPVDGRVFLSKSTKKYDIIFSDAYNSFISVPWHLTTKEFFQLSKEKLSTNGMFAMNFISAQQGNNSEFYKSLIATFSSVYDNYYIFTYGNDPTATENIVLVGLNSSSHMPSGVVSSKLLDLDGGTELANHLLKNNIPDFSSDSIVLTDDFAPVDRLMMPSINAYFGPYLDFIYKKT